MEKWKINLIIDACMLLCGAALAGIGLLLKYVLPPGRERMAIYGRNVDLTLLGLDRHEWGAIHLWLACGMVALVVLHLLVHLPWIVAILRKVTLQSAPRIGAVAVFLLLCLALMVTPFFITPRIIEVGSDAAHAPFVGKGSGRGVLHGRAR
ncbi:MAG: DUF4405 domain-containing protein [Desulfobacterota bacterium]|nr:DUF4405 domain-containing protein [Thermodesulfobacteriota bacterium]